LEDEIKKLKLFMKVSACIMCEKVKVFTCTGASVCSYKSFYDKDFYLKTITKTPKW